MITRNISTLKINKLTQAQYDRELAAGNIDENALYLTPDEDTYTQGELDAMFAGKAEADHAHTIDDVDGLQANLDSLGAAIDSKVAVTRKINGKALSSDITLSASDIGVEAGAQVNTVTGVKGNSESTYRTGNINITKANIGLGNVDNTADSAKPVSTAQQSAIDASLASAKTYADGKVSGLASTSSVNTSISNHNTSSAAHADIRDLITGLTTRLNTLADSDDTTLDQLSEIVTYIKNNKSLIDGITTSKVNVSDIVDNLTTNITNKPLSAAQGVAIKALIDALQTAVNGKAASSHTHKVVDITDLTATATELNYMDGVTSSVQSQLDSKANKSDIATTKSFGASNSAAIYVKISDFGAWGTGTWYQKGFSILITSRAGEMVWCAVSSDDSNTNAKAIRLLNTYSKIANIYYSASESAIYVKANAWCNNINAHVLSNVNGDYVPTVAQASALASDAVEIPIIPFGITGSSTDVGGSSVALKLAGSATRPTYNGSDMALSSDVSSLSSEVANLKSQFDTLVASAVSVHSGNAQPVSALGEDGDIYLVT